MTIYLVKHCEYEKKRLKEALYPNQVICVSRIITPSKEAFTVLKASSAFDVASILRRIPPTARSRVLFHVSPRLEKELERVFPYLKFITAFTDDSLLKELISVPFEEPQNLTARESEVLYRVAAGESCSEISAGLSIKESTVYSYKKKLLRKLNLTSTQQLQLYAYLELFIRTPRS